jgi:competence CoiA-like predicted nuclease
VMHVITEPSMCISDERYAVVGVIVPFLIATKRVRADHSSVRNFRFFYFSDNNATCSWEKNLGIPCWTVSGTQIVIIL